MIRRSQKRMTLVSLKRHMDRRFAATASKKDLERFATKDDLATLETRMDARFGQVMRRLESLDEKIDSVRGAIPTHRMLLDEHERRLQDLEALTR